MPSRSSIPVLAVALVALVGWLRGGAPSGGSEAGSARPASKPEASAKKKVERGAPSGSARVAAPGGDPEEPWRRPLGLLAEARGLPADPRETRAKAVERLRAALRPPDFDLRFLIALVPDPVDSQQPAAFDLALDGIQQGFAYASEARKSYLLDRIWIPWNDEATAGSQGYRSSPGLLLFRRLQERGALKDELVGVFLVGETPKRGIHKAAFREALQMIAELSGDSRRSVRILGPSYSGSALSLRIALRNWQEEHPEARGGAAAAPRFVIVTGSARAPCLESLFAPGSGLEGAELYRAQTPLDALLSTALDELRDRLGWNLHRMALITELDTAYGDSVSNPRLGFDLYLSCRPRRLPGEIAVVRFPSHISAIRTARVAAGLDRQETEATPAAPPPVTDLQLDLADRRVGADVVPDFSPLSAPASELAIADLAAALSRDGVRYVGILASDVKDTIFLADRFHRLAPNISLFALENDLLFTHPQVLSAFSGMTVASASRLFTSRTSWEHATEGFDPARVVVTERRGPGEEPTPWQVTTSFETGIYQATVELLSPVSLAAAVRPDGGPVWISVVGNDALWPLGGRVSPGLPESSKGPRPRVLSLDQLVRLEARARPNGPGPLAAGEPGEETRGGKAAEAGDETGDGEGRAAPASAQRLRSREAMLGSDLDLALFALLLGAGAWGLHKAALLPAPSSDAPAERGTRRLLVGGLAGLGGAAAVLLVLCGLPHWTWMHPASPAVEWTLRQKGSFAALALAYAFLTGAGVYAAAFRRSPGGALPYLRSGGAAVAVLAAAAVVPPGLVGLACGRWLLCDADFHQRVRAFASGLSPLVSLAWLVAAFYLWALYELQRRRLTAWQRIEWPLAEAFEPALAGCTPLLAEVRWLLARTLPRSGWRRLVLACGFTGLLAVVWYRLQPAAEPPELGRLLLALWALAALVSAISVYRFYGVWQALRKLLVRIESTPLAARLGELSKELRWKPMQAFGWQMPPFQTLIDSLVRLKQLVRDGKLDLTPEEAAEQLSELDHFLGLAFAADVKGRVIDEIASREEVQSRIARIGAGLMARRDEPEVADFFAVRVAAYLRYVFAQLRSTLITALGPALLLLVAVSAYTFQPKGVVTLGLLALVAGEIAVAVSAFMAMSRNTVLSLIAGNTPGEVTFDFHFFSSLVTFGVVPLLGLIATQVPAAGQLLNSTLKPLFHLAGVG